jgi:hypothetical protein
LAKYPVFPFFFFFNQKNKIVRGITKMNIDLIQKHYTIYTIKRAEQQQAEAQLLQEKIERDKIFAEQRARLNNPKTVTTRTPHACATCNTVIPKGALAVKVTVKRACIPKYNNYVLGHVTEYYCQSCKPTTEAHV